MSYQNSTIVVTYGELSTKGANRKDFIRQLRLNIKKALEPFEEATVSYTYNRIYILCKNHDPKLISEKLKWVFGIATFSIGYPCELNEDKLKALALDLAIKENKKTFKIETRRRNKKFGNSSDYINRLLAGEILRNSEYQVDVHHPELRIKVEIDEKQAYVMVNQQQGAKGYPVGVQGKAMLLLSGGIDSPVAAYMMMKRGVQLDCIHFAAQPYTSQNALEKVKTLLGILTKFQPEFKLHIVNFTPTQLEIYEKASESYAITLMRRYMVRIAQKRAEQVKCKVLVSGESLGQVASQTMESIDVINRAVSMPIFRPLIGMDKNEIIRISKEIGTYETSILPFEDCCTIFDPKDPVTKPKLEKVLKFEEKIEVDKWIDLSLSDIEVVKISFQNDEFF
ncbi:MAG: tRNA 4-thiouridine(8) synthase ThiI [Erysipelothrix sp.]|nr:tRNA 4-thiouridine(8) synthase ThiI [Erysipelothrix sp.]